MEPSEDLVYVTGSLLHDGGSAAIYRQARERSTTLRRVETNSSSIAIEQAKTV